MTQEKNPFKESSDPFHEHLTDLVNKTALNRISIADIYLSMHRLSQSQRVQSPTL